MKAMVFAAGYGERLRPLTEKLPKALVPVAGRPMIEYSLCLLRHYGIREIIINLHHLGEMIEEHLKDGKKLGLKITYSREKELLDTGGGLLQARAFLEDRPFIAINSDVMIDLPLADLFDEHRRHKATATLVLRSDRRAASYGTIATSRDSRIQSFLGHRAPRSHTVGPLAEFMFTGVQYLNPRVFDYLASDSSISPGGFSITKSTYPKMLTQGELLYGFPFEGYWQDLGTTDRIREAEERLATCDVTLHYLD
ncbi:MAG: NDP-sugar synthase [Candidatus Binatia bacterium]